MISPEKTSYPKDKIKVLLLENVHQSAISAFQEQGFAVETKKGALSDDELTAALSDVHVLGIRSKTQVRAKHLKNAKRLLSLGCFCIGTNQVDVDECNKMGVPVFNAPFSNTRSVAELVIAEVIALARQLFDRSREVHEGKWRKISANCHEVRGKTIGIVGYGHIGSQVGILAEMLGMRVVFYDIATKLPLGNNRPVATLDAVLREADFVTLHVPATPKTHNMIGERELKLMKPGSHLLNISRGTVVAMPALAAAIKEGHIGGAAVDVYPDEPEANGDNFTSELRNLPNVILSPHIGGSTEEAQEAIGREVSTSLMKFINAGATTGAVNFPQIELPIEPGKHRILNVHRNVPGVLSSINGIVSKLQANIHSQLLATDPHIGYLMMDLDHDVSNEVRKEISELSTNIRTRILY
ncbi:MAG: phosphoglycerate dehydrogenase [Deltaproteobacteria bacterium]|nr:phosphoglycerate dehydrogenase [Deltaproteobacteria bacterium]